MRIERLRHRVSWLLVGLCLSLAGARAVAAPVEVKDWSREDAAHLLRRAGFGGTPEQIDRLHSYGKVAAVEYLLTGDAPVGKEAIFTPVDLAPFKMAELPEDRQTRQRASRQEVQRMRMWWVDRMTRTDRPLEEKMTLFWHGLFCSGVREVKDGTFMVEQNALFHTQAMGNYRKLTQAMIHDPALLLYLNAEQNIRGKPNENLARELMELFTMGEGNGYTEKDIAEVARALTGLAANRQTHEYVFRRLRHDPGVKVIFGKRGNYVPDDVVNLIFERPQPAQYLARRLWVFFASPDPSPEDLAPIVEAINRKEYDVTAALRALFMSPRFYDEKCKFSLIRGPVELAVSTARNLEVSPGERAQREGVLALDRMGQELCQPPNVRGWPGGEQWVTSATLYTRYNACTAMVMGTPRDTPPASPAKLFPQLAGPTEPAKLVDAAVSRFLQRPLHEAKKATLVETLGKEPLRPGNRADDEKIRQMIALLLSTPEYQVQ